MLHSQEICVTKDQSTLTRAEIARSIQSEVGLNHSHSRRLVDAIVENMAGALVESGKLKLSGFGTFFVMQKGVRFGRNPRNGEPHPVTARRVLSFKASPTLKSRITL